MTKIDDKNFKCPFCVMPVKVIERKRIETLSDHVCDPNGNGSIQDIYACTNDTCLSNEPGVQIRWDWNGDLYIFGSDYKRAREVSQSVTNDAPFGTGSRRSNIEIYKKGLKNRMLEIFPKWYLFNFGLFIEYVYTADYEGNVLSRKRKAQLLKKSGSGAVYFTPGIITYFRFLKSFKENLKCVYEKDSKYSMTQIEDAFKPLPVWDKRLWHRAFKWTINTFYKNVKIELLDKTKNLT